MLLVVPLVFVGAMVLVLWLWFVCGGGGCDVSNSAHRHICIPAVDWLPLAAPLPGGVCGWAGHMDLFLGVLGRVVVVLI